MSRTYCIADLHGRFDLLCAAIDRIEGDAGLPGGRLIVLGDFIDRGPHSRHIIDLLMAGSQRPGWEWIILQGNHEAMMLQVLGAPTPPLLRWWFGNGGDATLISYGYQHGDDIAPLKVPPEHLSWLATRPLTFEDAHRIYVHAGVPFDQAVGDAAPATLQWMLYPGDVDHGDAEVHADLSHISGKHIVHGHHQSAAHPLLKPHRTNLDGFAWKTGRCAIGVFDDTEAGGPVELLTVQVSA